MTDSLFLLKKFRKQKILVIGDFILDVYLHGNCNRIAPEASVPIVDLISKKVCLGGAANAAANLHALGCEVLFCTVIGTDEAAATAISLLNESAICTAHIIQDEDRNTLVKTRISSSSNMLLRFDEGSECTLNTETECKFISRLIKAYECCDGVLIADYNKGTLTPAVISALKKMKLKKHKFIAVDGKRTDIFAEIQPGLIKPNYDEAIKLLSLPYSKDSRVEQLKPFGSHFLQKTNAHIIALTLDREGALFFKDGQFINHYEAPKVLNPIVSGAGDTFISTCLLALVCGASLDTAASMATAAAGIAINKSDTAVCSSRELTELLVFAGKTSTLGSLRWKCKNYKAEGKKIVFTNGCFDLLHSGHVNYLRKAKGLGDVLVVGINNDESVKRIKGRNRPVNTLTNRIEVLAALEFIDHVIPFGNQKDDTPASLIKLVHPDTFVKGADYKNKQLPEGKLLSRLNCRIVFLPYVYNESTTQIISRIEASSRLKIAN